MILPESSLFERLFMISIAASSTQVADALRQAKADQVGGPARATSQTATCDVPWLEMGAVLY